MAEALLWWAREHPVTDLADEAEISEGAACGIYQWLHEVCSTPLLTPIVLGGAGIVVQADESQFRHKPKKLGLHNYVIVHIKIAFYLQHHRGRASDQDMWAFGLVDTSHTSALGYVQVVLRSDAATLLPIIQTHVAPGSVVHTDEWQAYSGVRNIPSVLLHGTVNNSISTSLIQSLESTYNMWNRTGIASRRS